MYSRSAACKGVPAWEPIFEPDASMLSSIGDGVLKLNQAVDGYITDDVMGDLTGIKKIGGSEEDEGYNSGTLGATSPQVPTATGNGPDNPEL